jgi:excisionase family DNA binding protein
MTSGLNNSARITVDELATRLSIGRLAVYAMLEQGIIPGIRLGRRWIVTRKAFEQWELTCGMKSASGLASAPEVSVVN